MDAAAHDADWHRWLEASAGRFLLYARERTPCEADAQDVLQEALIESWQRTPPTRVPDDALVYATIRRRAIDQARSRIRRAGREDAWATEAGGDVAWFQSGVEDAELRATLEEGLRGLPETYREVITLKLWGGLTFAEIGRATSVPLNTAASRWRYGIEALRQRIKHALV